MTLDPFGNYAEGKDILKTEIRGTIDDPISYKFPVDVALKSTSFQLIGHLIHSQFGLHI